MAEAAPADLECDAAVAASGKKNLDRAVARRR